MPTSHFHYVYILWDASTHSHFYVGHTSDLAARLKTHNAGHVPHTSKFTPWE
ncbi:MAG: GIY-YIG nuclease family protein, partial [Akkermansia sp.]|nr:GIY-YIG nuclease family protein [Akkermansia sp.]